jgi:aminopeptidase-like protein
VRPTPLAGPSESVRQEEAWRGVDFGASLHALIAELYPLCRSITGDGLRATLRRIGGEMPLTLHEVPSGTPVLDWTVPREWNIRDAYVANDRGQRVIDFQRSSLHVVNYSVPVRRRMSLAELRPYLHTLPQQPDWVPYRTSYYKESWGFCLSQRQLDTLPDGNYDVVIDSTLEPGHLTYGECVIPGRSTDEVLISCHSCHPSLANDNLSGMVVAMALARWIQSAPRRLTYRLLFIPGTIGSITWLARNEPIVPRIKHGLVLSCVGDAGQPTYKKSRRGDALVDRAVQHVLATSGAPYRVREFVPYGYDERQYCSPGFDLPVGCFTRTPNGEFPEYHSSADNLELVTPESLTGSYETLVAVLEVLERDGRFMNLSPKGEPQLGRRGLYQATGGHARLPGFEMSLLWVLSYSDGQHTLLDIAERASLPFATIRHAADALQAAGLLADVP